MRSLTSLTSKSIEDYLSTILRLESVFGVAKTGDIAHELNVNYGTVTNMLNKLERVGLLKRQRYEGVTLTKRGKVIAEETIKRHRITERLLTDVIGVSPEDAHRFAHKIEHDVKEIIDQIDFVLGYPDKCPHGNPIFRKVEVVQHELRLKDTNEGQTYIINRISIENDEVISFLKGNGLWIGRAIKVKLIKKSSLQIEADNKIVKVPPRFSELIFVKKVT
ncbi:MAG: metal-dependent transcriptional regulator [Thaumarchaeota archaeon]|jgi:DtxR family Mn-dependent transcriptional regulator|nr:metal-dependent transcriptional regulator [Nitrososphaerota archaeon]